ncbi:CocE/NonD family hydrolase [uncultured Nocardioides sp.]|uniref:CocE/NonD family hydrolase n=1 Tax=uncultured Nocardioides sp. TaxID=198441 RepID=UPI00260ABCA1|nr:CocE/NonD family hydrolase [uncultured Nocardioides sp.]
MRDGVELLTDVYSPAAGLPGTVLIRTPYGRDGLIAQLTAGFFAGHGYHVVNQGCRGTSGSGGTLDPFRQERADGADTVAWLRRQPWFGGRLALWGASYQGHAAWAVLADPPPEVVTAVIVNSAHDAHWATHGAGAFSLEEVAGLMDGLGHLEAGTVRGLARGVTAARRLRPAFEELPLVKAQDLFARTGMPYADWLVASDREDPLWRDMRLGQALDRVTVPVLLQTGWQDRFPAQMIEAFERLQQRGVDTGLTIGPWTHVQTLTKGAAVVMTEALDWLAEHLAAAPDRKRPSPVRIYVTGAREWRRLQTWPPPPTSERVLYLRPTGGLAGTPPSATAGPTTFTYDPARPTPAVGGRVINPAIGGHRDNRELEARADVVTFTSPPLTEPLDVLGEPVVEVVHETDNPYADLFVRLCEVRRSGRSVNISDGFVRLGPEDANGTIVLRLDAVAHRFTSGNRLRLQVSGGAHPRYARNLGTDQDPATGTDLVPSAREVRHGSGGLSLVRLPCSL